MGKYFLLQETYRILIGMYYQTTYNHYANNAHSAVWSRCLKSGDTRSPSLQNQARLPQRTKQTSHQELGLATEVLQDKARQTNDLGRGVIREGCTHCTMHFLTSEKWHKKCYCSCFEGFISKVKQSLLLLNSDIKLQK